MNTQQANSNPPLFSSEDEKKRRILYVLTTEMTRARLDQSLRGKYNKSARRENLTNKMNALASGQETALMKDQIEVTSVDLLCRLQFPFSQLAEKGGNVQRDLRELLTPDQRRKIAGLAGHITSVGVVGQGHNTPFSQILFELDCARETSGFMSRNPSLPVAKSLFAQEQSTQHVSPALGAWESGTYFGLCQQVDMRTKLENACSAATGLDFEALFPGLEERVNERRAEVVASLKSQGRFDFDTPDVWYSCGTDMDELIESWGSGLTEEVLRNGTVLGNMKEGRSFVLAHSLLGSYLLRDTSRNFFVFPGTPEIVDVKNPEDPKKSVKAPVLPESEAYFIFAPNDAINDAVKALTGPASLHSQLIKATYRAVESINLTVHSGEAQSGVYKNMGDGTIALIFNGAPLFALPANYDCVFNLKLRVTVTRNRIETNPNDYTDKLVVSANPLMHNSWPQAVFPEACLLARDRPNVIAGTPSLVYTQAQLSQRKSESLNLMAQVAAKRQRVLEAGNEISSSFDDSVKLAHEHAEQTGEMYRGDLESSSSAAASSSSSSSSSVPVEDD